MGLFRRMELCVGVRCGVIVISCYACFEVPIVGLGWGLVVAVICWLRVRV